MRLPRCRRYIAVSVLVFLLVREGDAQHNLVSDLDQPQGLAIDVGEGRLYWTEVSAKTIARAYVDSNAGVEAVVPPASEYDDAPYSIALDHTAGKVYWTTPTSINRANLNGSDVEEVINVSCVPGGIALDVDAGQIYWTIRTDGKIYRASMNGSVPEPLDLPDLEIPNDLAIDHINRKVYWADVGKKTVERADLDTDGAAEILNVSWEISQTTRIALDPYEQRIYFTGSSDDPLSEKSGNIYRASLSGDDSEVLISGHGLSVPWGITYDHVNHALYWTDQQAGTIQGLRLQCTPGSVPVPSQDGVSIAEVSYGYMNHGQMTRLACPKGYSGQVYLTCSDGAVALSSYQCAEQCEADSIEAAGSLNLTYGDLDSGDVATADCGEGLIGPVSVRCTDGELTVTSGTCRTPRNCTSGAMTLDNALLEFSDMAHRQEQEVSCPASFSGSYLFRCDDGAVDVVSGRCVASCDAGTVWVEDGADVYAVPHDAIKPGKTLRVPCPSGSAGEGVTLECTGSSTLKVQHAQCIRLASCDDAHQTIDGAVLAPGFMYEGDTRIATCPANFTGSINFTCVGGRFGHSGHCYLSCPAGEAEDEDGVIVHHGVVAHDTWILAACPAGYRGAIPLVCSNGNLTVDCTSECACEKIVEDRPHDRPHDDLDAVPLAANRSEANMSETTMSERTSELSPGPGLSPPLEWILPLAAAVTVMVMGTLVIGRQVRRQRGRSDSRKRPRARPVGGPSFLHERGWTGAAPAEASTAEVEVVCELNEVVVDCLVPLPSYWATQDGIHISPDTNRINEVQQLMNETWRVCYTRDRRLIAGEDRLPVGCRVASVLRIENHPGYERYWRHKADVLARRPSGCRPFATETDASLNLLDMDCNEKYLFHGTNPEAAHAIARNLFRIDMAGSCRGCMFGPGIYLAENASKSDEYAKEGSGVYVGLCAMLICRALAGNVLNVESSGDFSELIKNGDYDSLCGDRLAAAGTFREMVFFHEHAVYPEFIVIYARAYGES